MIIVTPKSYIFFKNHVIKLKCKVAPNNKNGGNKMKLKRKIIAIATVLILLTIPLSIVEAREQPENNKNETYKVEILTVKTDGIIKNEEIIVQEEDLVELVRTKLSK